MFGGGAVVLAVLIVQWLSVWLAPTEFHLPVKSLISLTLAAAVILIGGFADDRWHLSPGRQLIAPIISVLIIIIGGIGVQYITNPFGGVWRLDQVNLDILTYHGVGYHLTLWADLFTFAWLIGCMYATKILDGLDGLVSGLGVIGAIIVFLLTLRPEVNQPDIGVLALTFAGACAGFLIFNWHPASIFLGESGSLFIGFMLGVLAIISGGKVATALLILGLPILDLLFVILYRRFALHQSPFKTADRTHLHFRFLDAGWPIRRTVLFFYLVTAVFGLSTLFVHGLAKVWVLGLLALLTLVIAWSFSRRQPVIPHDQPES